MAVETGLLVGSHKGWWESAESKPGEDMSLAILRLAGMMLDEKFAAGKEPTVRDVLMELLLRIREKSGREVAFSANEAQQQIGRKWGKKNIILKARQLGITTYVAARFFIETITRPGTLTVQVAHDQRSAEDIFRMVHRFQENLPEALREGVLKTSRANVRQLVWPRLDSEYRVESAADPNAGRGTTIRNLHCSEVARWSRDGAEALTSLRAAVPPDGQVVMEALFGSKTGSQKKDAAISFVTSALSLGEAVTTNQVVDEGKFRDGIGKVIDGVVECLNASVWANKAGS